MYIDYMFGKVSVDSMVLESMTMSMVHLLFSPPFHMTKINVAGYLGTCHNVFNAGVSNVEEYRSIFGIKREKILHVLNKYC